MSFNYCNKCGTIMKQIIRYSCGYPVIEYICPIHGSESTKIKYSNKTEWDGNLNVSSTVDYKENEYESN